VLDPGRGRTKTGQLWAYARDDRPWGGADPPAVAYLYAPDRKSVRPINHLAGFKGTLQVDGYGGYAALARRGDVQLAFCWAHVRRHFYELADTSPVAVEALARIAKLYAIDAAVRGQSPEQRRAARQTQSRPVIEDLHRFFDAKLAQLSRKSNLAEALRYALTRWEGLTRFLDDGRIELDNNSVERAIRPLALNRKNALFAGSDDGGDRQPHRDVQAQWRQSAGLAQRHPRKPRRRSQQPQARRTHALELSRRCGLRTSLTDYPASK
jgi:transposase